MTVDTSATTSDLRARIARALRDHQPPTHVDPAGLPKDEFDCCADAVMAVIGDLRDATTERDEAWRLTGKLATEVREMEIRQADETKAAQVKLAAVRELAESWAARAPADDWGESMGDTALADAGRAVLTVLDGSTSSGED